MTNKQLEAYVESVRWKTAKRPDHAYTVVGWYPNLRKEFYEFVSLIRKEGYHVRHWRQDYLCYNIGEYKYWTMFYPAADGVEIPGHAKHYPLGDTILINRNKIDGTGV